MLIPPNSDHYFTGQSAKNANYKTQTCTSGHALLLKPSVYVIKLTSARADERPCLLRICTGTPEMAAGHLYVPWAKGKLFRVYK